MRTYEAQRIYHMYMVKLGKVKGTKYHFKKVLGYSWSSFHTSEVKLQLSFLVK